MIIHYKESFKNRFNLLDSQNIRQRLWMTRMNNIIVLQKFGFGRICQNKYPIVKTHNLFGMPDESKGCGVRRMSMSDTGLKQGKRYVYR